MTEYKPRWQSLTYRGIAVCALAIAYLLALEAGDIFQDFHLEVGKKLVVDLGADFFIHVAVQLLIPGAIALTGIVKASKGRDRAGGLKGWFGDSSELFGD